MSTTDLEQRAERAVRRGELLVALEHFESYLAQQPDDERVRQRMESVRALLQPSELVSRRRVEPEEPQQQETQLSDAELGEMHASSGRFDKAAESYARAVKANPRNELLRERFEELRALAEPEGRAVLDDAEKLDAAIVTPTPVRGTPKVARSTKASDASFAPLPSGAAKKDPVALLQALLARVGAAKRRI